MTRLKLSLLCFFIFLNTTAQNPNSQVIESLKITRDNIQNKLHEVSPEEFSELAYQFINKLDSIIKRNKQLKKKKKLKKEKIKFDLQEIHELKARMMLNMMYYGFGISENLDSINYYRNEILSNTEDKVIRSQSHGFTAYTYYNLDNYTKSIEHYNKALQILEFPKNKQLRPFQIRVLVNLNTSLVDLNIVGIAEKNYNRLEETIQDMSSHKRYKNYIELLKIEKSNILISKKDFKNSLKTLETVIENNLDTEALKERYYDNLQLTYLGLENYILGEFYFNKAYPESYKDNEYYLNRLRYAVGNRNIEKADSYFSKIKKYSDFSSSSKIVSDYFTLKKEHEKANFHLRRAIVLMQKEETNMMSDRRAVFEFYNDFSKELTEMRRQNKLKDELIIQNQLLYIKIGVAILFVIIIILILLEWSARKKQVLNELEQNSKKTILEAKGRFLENMSHEIRTPITSILGYLTLLKQDQLILDKRIRFTNSAIANTKKMMNSLDNFLNLTTVDKNSSFEKIKSSINLSDFKKEIRSTFLANLEIKNIKLYFKTNAEKSLVINYDVESLMIIVNNLISNAIKYSNSNTSIYLTLNFTKSKMLLMIKDEGFGIKEDEKNKVFSRFYQTESNLTNSGFGIGLSLTNNLIKKLNGTIDLETELNVGSVFKVELPLTISNYNLNTTLIDNQFELMCLNEHKESETKTNEKLPKALVVDDNTEMIIYLKEIFSDFLDCTFAFNGKEALQLVKNQSFEIIISDLKMPIMNGIEFKEEVNKDDSLKDIPFIFMTSIFKGSLKDTDLLNFVDYIEKPFKTDEIISRIQFALEKSLNRKKLVATKNSEIEFESSSSELIEKIKNCILENIANPDFNVVMLCKTCGYGQKKLNEILKSKIGLSIVNTILEIRLLKAYDLIIKNRYETLKEVVYSVGMNSRPYFNKKFETRFGIKPGELRRKYKK